MPTDDTMSAPVALTYRREKSQATSAEVSGGLCRAMDIVLSVGLIIFLSPLMLFAAVVGHLQDGGPAIFAQPRVGKNGVMFRCFKFRSMVIDAERRLQDLLASDPAAAAEWAATQKLNKDPRITAWGQFIRKSSVDELPQLFNVLRGEMSLVGPRPIVPAEIVRYGRYFSEYTAAVPGITGLWQISGRSSTSYRQRVAMDVVFSRRRSASLYLRILVGTVPAVLMRDGAV